MQNPQRSFSGRRTTGTKTDTLPRTARSWSSPADMRAHPAGKLGEGATAVTGAELCERLFQSTPPARGATYGLVHKLRLFPISIHAPREGGDRAARNSGRRSVDFNPRPPRGGRLSTVTMMQYRGGISIHAPARGATFLFNDTDGMTPISIHAPREGGDSRPMRCIISSRTISIHAPREGGDLRLLPTHSNSQPISIHAPREGGRRGRPYLWQGRNTFQSTPPARGGDFFIFNQRPIRP